MNIDSFYTAERYANALLRDLMLPAQAKCEFVHPAQRIAQSGLASLTGRADGPAQLCPAPLATCADGALSALQALSDAPALRAIDAAALLGERAACFGYARSGTTSAGGSCRLLRAADGWLAVNLARESDWELMPAWLESNSARDWLSIISLVSEISVDAAVSRGRLLGLAVAAMAESAGNGQSWYRKLFAIAKPKARTHFDTKPLVIDLSSLWAGPLCSHLLQMLGARVIKIESMQRPDGARYGARQFFDLLNGNKECVAFDLNSQKAREQLHRLLLRADIVIEASRPRALRQLNIFAEDVIAKNPGLTWISISGYGREEPQANWVAFGDDAGVAAGLSQQLFEATDETLFCGDAIADPLTGMHAALAAWGSYLNGGGELLALSLREVTAYCRRFGAEFDSRSVRERHQAWKNALETSGQVIAPPRARTVTANAHAFGADTAAIIAEFDIAC